MLILNHKFTINEDTNTITELYLEFEGQNTAFASSGVQLRIWNFSTSQWDVGADYDGTAEVVLSSTIVSGCTNYINANKNLYIFGACKGPGVDLTNPTTFYADFVKVLVSGSFDNTPPAGISDLTALKGSGNGEIVLQWTSPGDDENTGNLTGQFEIEYTTGGIITNANYYSPPAPMTAISISTSNLAPLTACTTTLYNLIPGATYYFAIKAKDDADNISVWNSSADVTGVNTAAFLYIPSVVKSVVTGDWNDSGIWEGNSVPWPSQGVEIQSGHTVLFRVC